MSRTAEPTALKSISASGFGEDGKMKQTLLFVMLIFAVATKADYWMTFCKTPGGRQYSLVGYVKPDEDGFVTIKAGPITVVVYKTQVWYQKMPGEAPQMH